MADITYRRAQPDDAERMVAFYNRVGGETSYLSFERDEYPLDARIQRGAIQALESEPANIILLALSGEEIAGIASVSSPRKVKVRHDGALGIVVAQKYQGLGIGSELIRRLLDWAKGNGITRRISLDVRSDNTRAVRLYLRFGFAVEGLRRNAVLLDGRYYDMYIMGRML